MRQAAKLMLVALLLSPPVRAQLEERVTASEAHQVLPASSAEPSPAPPAPAMRKTVKNDTALDDAILQPPGADPDNRLILPLLKHMATDQREFWTSASELRRAETWKTFAPFAGVTGLLIAKDGWISRQVPMGGRQLSRSKEISDYGMFSLAGTAGGAYLWGHLTRNDHLAETGFLAGEAALNSLAAAYAMEQIARRPRPFQGDGNGRFFTGGTSFPSDHAAISWSVASVVAHEYPGPLTRFAAYGLASAVTITRVTARQHFPSDVVIGSALGWYFARQVYRARHDAELGGTSWGKLVSDDDAAPPFAGSERARDPAKMGSPAVPLDSWIYPALERLAAFGYIRSSFAGLKPWTRLECAQMTADAGEAIVREENENREAARLASSLREEFSREFRLLDGERNLSANLESVYVRDVSASGPVLTDGYHFGQTLAYDFGRPFRRGDNGQAGSSFSVMAGPLILYARAEFQHAPSASPLSDAVRNFIANADLVPAPAGTRFAAINRPRLLDAYIALKLGAGWQLAFGRQSLEWAPGPGGSFLFSDNAEPLTMLRLTQNQTRLPGPLRFLGPARVDNFIGQLTGYSFVPHPYIYGSKINFKPLPGLELGFGRTVTIGGQGGNPLTAKNLFLSFFGQTSSQLDSVPGDSHTSFDWTFYVPGVRNYLVFYGDLYADDDFVPFENQPKNPDRPGIYITRFPRFPKLDFHMEAANSESPGQPHNIGNLNYWNYQYRDGYTNNGNLIGNTVGRMGRAIQCWTTYWISPQNTLQFSYKHSSVSPDFVPQGGYWQDYSVRSQWHLGSGFYIKSEAQYEHISSYPLLFRGPVGNMTAIVELGVIPRGKK